MQTGWCTTRADGYVGTTASARLCWEPWGTWPKATCTRRLLSGLFPQIYPLLEYREPVAKSHMLGLCAYYARAVNQAPGVRGRYSGVIDLTMGSQRLGCCWVEPLPQHCQTRQRQWFFRAWGRGNDMQESGQLLPQGLSWSLELVACLGATQRSLLLQTAVPGCQQEPPCITGPYHTSQALVNIWNLLVVQTTTSFCDKRHEGTSSDLPGSSL